MSQQRLPVDAGKVQLARREGNLAALRDGFGPGLTHGLVLIEFHTGEIHAEGIFHLLAHHRGHIDPVPRVRQQRAVGERGLFPAADGRLRVRLLAVLLSLLCVRITHHSPPYYYSYSG